MKTKTFDCVDMKRRAQRGLTDEFQSRRAEFKDFGQFLRARIRGSDWASRVWTKLGGNIDT